MAFNLPNTTHALQLVRCDVAQNCFVYYEAVTFPENDTRGTIDMYLRRASICGRIGEGVESLYTVDILDADGMTLQELPIERKAARYLVEKLKLRVERD
jgi:hypothetical protein